MRALLIFSISFVICKRIETGQNSAITATQTGNALIDGLEFYKSVFLRRQNRQKNLYSKQPGACCESRISKKGVDHILPKLCGSH